MGDMTPSLCANFRRLAAPVRGVRQAAGEYSLLDLARKSVRMWDPRYALLVNERCHPFGLKRPAHFVKGIGVKSSLNAFHH